MPIDNQTLSLIISGRIKDVNLDSFTLEEWDLLVKKAQSEGVAPLVYWVFSREGKFLSLPKTAWDSLKVLYAITWMQNYGYFQELEMITRRFQQAEIPIVALKGVCFALTIYPDIGLRPMGDMDLLVPFSRLAESVQIVKTLGYFEAKPEASPGLQEMLNHEICLQKEELFSTTLELHRTLIANEAYSYAVPMDWFWEQTERLEASLSKKQFENLLMLTPTAQVLYAASHAMLQHGGKNAPLCWFFDLDCLLRFYAGRMDWDLLLSQAEKFEWSSALEAALSQTYTYFDTCIPEHVRTSLGQHPDRHRQLVSRQQIRPSTYILDEHQRLLSLNWYSRFRLVLALITPNPAYMRWRYHLKSSWALPAYYLYRWWVIFKDLVFTLLYFVKVS